MMITASRYFIEGATSGEWAIILIVGFVVLMMWMFLFLSYIIKKTPEQ